MEQKDAAQMNQEDVADIQTDLGIDKKVADILRQCEENIIRMHLDRARHSYENDTEDELRDHKILGNFQRVMLALSTAIMHEITSVKHGHYEQSKKDEIIRYLEKMRRDIMVYEDHIAQLSNLVRPPSKLVNHPELAQQMRNIMIKNYDELHDLYRDIISLDAAVDNKIRSLLHTN